MNMYSEENVEHIDGCDAWDAAMAEAKAKGYNDIFRTRYAEAKMTDSGWVYSMRTGWKRVDGGAM